MSDFVMGVGLNDSNYPVSPINNGKQKRCNFYQVWKSMLERCYDKKYQSRFPTYIDCTVIDEWLIFSNFKKWMEKQDWQGKHLDKDLLIYGNKVYSPQACAFVDPVINSFLTEKRSKSSELPVGVSFHKGNNSFLSRCSNPLTGKRDNLGYFHCANLAHQAWRERKHELACKLADIQIDDRIASALRTRYL